MIRPEDVDAELVEKAARARISAQHGRPLTDAEWSAVRSRIEEVWIASTLAAVLPDIQAEALEEAAESFTEGGMVRRRLEELARAARLRAEGGA